ncbi:MAG: hypothetical protein EOL90_04835 [Spartobacteria bacterium]|nr:hypothetical protein [Spartobacteria bacterium]
METDLRQPPKRRPRTWIWKGTLAVALAYGALQVLVRTDVFRSQVEEELSRLAGMEVRIGRMRATESLNLKIRDAIGISDVAGIEARVARVRWRLFRPRGTPMLESVRVDGLALTIAPDDAGALQPAFLGRLSRNVFAWTGLPVPAELAAAPDAEAVPARPDGPARSLEEWLGGPLVLQNVSVRWQDAQGLLRASVSGMDVVWTPLTTPKGRRVSHLDCRAAEIKVVNGPRIADLRLELVAVEDQRFLVTLQAADWGGAEPPPAPGAEARELLDAMDVPLDVRP